jgi:hypothetical protein
MGLWHTYVREPTAAASEWIVDYPDHLDLALAREHGFVADEGWRGLHFLWSTTASDLIELTQRPGTPELTAAGIRSDDWAVRCADRVGALTPETVLHIEVWDMS